MRQNSTYDFEAWRLEFWEELEIETIEVEIQKNRDRDIECIQLPA